jgi:hypothetical protein
MIATQLELIKPSRKRFDETHVDEMIRRLKAGATPENGGWLKSTDLGARTWSEKRDLRIIKQLSKGRIVGFPGSSGYKPAEDCTLEELRHFRRATVSQCRVMLANVRQTERLAHAALAK